MTISELSLIKSFDNLKLINENNKIKNGLKRDKIDKFYTKNEIALLCINYIKDKIIFSENDLIIEPSAGNGVFLQYIKELPNKDNIFIDIKPDNEEIIQMNYFDFNYKNLSKQYNNIHIIGNPPFGRQSSTAIKFIKKSAEFANSISFILPKSFKKESMKKKIPLNFHLYLEVDIPENGFLLDDKEYNVPCIFQIWKKREFNRELVNDLIPNNFNFVKKNEEPDISFRRVGVNAGFIDKETKNKNIQSHYFIKFNKNNIDENIENLKKIKFEFNNTVGPKSISKQELINEFNKYLDN